MHLAPEGNYDYLKQQEVEDSAKYDWWTPLPNHVDKTKEITGIRRGTTLNIAQATNNPWNIVYNPSTYAWLWASWYYTNTNNWRRYLVFNSPEAWVRAMRRLIQYWKSYKHKDSIKDRLSTWVHWKPWYKTPHAYALAKIAPELLIKPVSKYDDNDWEKVQQAIMKWEWFN